MIWSGGSEPLLPIARKRLNVQASPGDLLSLNTLDSHSLHRVLLPIGLCPMIVQFGPDRVSFCYLAQDLYLYVWNRCEEEAPVFPHTCLPDEISFRVERLLTAIVWGKKRHHHLQIVPIGRLYHALEHHFRGRIGLRILCLFL